MRVLRLLGVTMVLMLVGCQDRDAAPGDPAPAAAATQPAAPPDEAPTGEDFDALLASADLDRGQRLYIQCQACHGLLKGEAHKVGPNLHGMFSRKIGTAEDFNYSTVLVEAGFDWTPSKLDEWLAQPSQFLPGNRMAFIGISDPQDRANVIAYLQKVTQ